VWWHARQHVVCRQASPHMSTAPHRCCRYTTAQFQRYVDRFGDGLVIYWFDFIDTLNDVPGADGRPAAGHPGVYVTRDFPSDFLLPTDAA
jgi:hypothetical protein